MILQVQPQSQLAPFPMIMGCEGTAASMLLDYNGIVVSPKTLMEKMPKDKSDPSKGYVGVSWLVSIGVHQTIFPEPLARFLSNYLPEMVDGTGLPIAKLEAVIDRGQPVIIYPVNRGRKPKYRTYKMGNSCMTVVSNIHAVLLVGYDKKYYYFIDPVKKQIGNIYVPAFWPSQRQIFKVKKRRLKRSYDDAGRLALFRNV